MKDESESAQRPARVAPSRDALGDAMVRWGSAVKGDDISARIARYSTLRAVTVDPVMSRSWHRWRQWHGWACCGGIGGGAAAGTAAATAVRCWRSGEHALLVMAEIRHTAGGSGDAAAGGGGDRLLAATAICCWRWRWRSAARGGGGGGAVALLATARSASSGGAAGERAHFWNSISRVPMLCVPSRRKKRRNLSRGTKGLYGWCTSPVNGPAFTCRCAGADNEYQRYEGGSVANFF